MLVISLLGFGQVSKQQAINSVLNSVVGNHVDAVNVYMEPSSKSDSYYKMSRYDSIQSPYANYWLFFIDDMPEYGWGHDCRYVFVNAINGEKHIRNSQIPPWHYKLKLETISESFAFNSFPQDTIIHFDTGLVVKPVEGKYAVLFSGGEIEGNHNPNFWNALSHSYCGLLENGFKKENIFVLSCKGDTVNNRYLDLNQDGTIDILNDTCNVENLQSIFDSLAIIMGEGDLLYVFGTMHGFHNINDTTSHGLFLWEEEPLYDTVFAKMLSPIKCSQIIVNIWACYSGGMADEIIHIQNNNARKTILTCTDKNHGVMRNLPFFLIAKMDVYNYFISTSLRYHHSDYNNNAPWNSGVKIGELQDSLLFSTLYTDLHNDINYDLCSNNGNGNGISEINEAIKYVSRLDSIEFKHRGVKYHDCGFKDDLLSLHGITGKVVTIDTVCGSFHIEDTLSVCAQALRMEDFAKFYLFDADLIIEDTATLVMDDSTAIIARSGNCRIIIKGGMSIGNGVTFEAKEGSTLQIVFENDADLSVSNATFINCDLKLPGRNISFSNCHFIGTPFSATALVSDEYLFTLTLLKCSFIPNGSTLSKAVFIKNYAHFLIQGCLIDGSVEQSFTNGIFIQNCGVNVGLKQIEGNTIVGCTDTGLTLYASFGDIRLNQITGNGYGVKLLNNCNIDRFSGNCEATTGADTQYIHDNTFNELYMTANCVPERFRYNYIYDDDNIPFVYHDVTVSFGNPVGPIRDPIKVKYNYWGSNFSPSTHLYTNSNTGYEYTPCWNMGICMDDDLSGAGRLLSEADSLNNIGEYARAKTVFMLVVENYPNTICAETALKSLLILEAFAGNHYDTLKSYYQNNIVITSDENLRHLASSLANKCDEKLENYNEAIAWYENVLMDPNTSFNDSIFAAIDLGDLYLKIEAGGEKAIGKLEKYRPKSAIEHELQTDRALSLLPRKTSIEQGLSELSPIRDLNSSVGNNDTVLLTWDLPSDSNLEPMTLSWLMNDTINDHVQAGYDSYMGNLYDTLDLRNLIGWKIETVSFYKCSNWTHVVYVFEQKRGEEMRVLYNQEIPDEMPFGLNTIRLEEDLVIEPNTRYWFALRITHHQGQQGYTYPFGVVCGEQGVEGKSNLCLMPGSNSWFEIPLPNEHFWIRACLVHPENIQSNKDDQSLTGYRVYRDGVHIKEIPYSFVTYFTDTEFTKGYDVEYCVTAVYGDGESEPVCVTASITGVADEFGDDGISVAPNPTNGLVHIEGALVFEVQVYNTIGQLVKTVQNANEVDLSGLAPGVYSLRIKDIQGVIINNKVVVKYL